MIVKETGIEGLLVLEPRVFKDPRGFFYESYHKEELSKYGIDYEFIQDNQSRSSYGVIRGLHYSNIWKVVRHRAQCSKFFTIDDTRGICSWIVRPF